MLRAPIDAIRWWNAWWVRRERYWKGFYYTFAISFAIFSFTGGTTPFFTIVAGAASLAFWVALGFWLSDRFKRRPAGSRR